MKRRTTDTEQFYASDPDELSFQLTRLFYEAEQRHNIPKGLLVPHAPILVSGSVATKAFLAIRSFATDIERVILLAQSDSSQSPQLLTCQHEVFCSPLGELAVDTATVNQLAEQQAVVLDGDIFNKTLPFDSLLPFLQLCLAKFQILPLLVGENGGEQLTQVLNQYWQDKTLLIACSNFSSDLEIEQAYLQDLQTVENIVKGTYLDNAELVSASFLLNFLLQYMAQRSIQSKLLKYQHSAAVDPLYTPPTGYASMMFY